jgi:hypothetical protein
MAIEQRLLVYKVISYLIIMLSKQFYQLVAILSMMSASPNEIIITSGVAMLSTTCFCHTLEFLMVSPI